jgi:biotin carboxylase
MTYFAGLDVSLEETSVCVLDGNGAVVREAKGLGVKALAVVADVAGKEQVEAMAARALSEFGRVDILINNAAIRPHKPFTEVTLDTQLDVQHGTVLLTFGVILVSRNEAWANNMTVFSAGVTTSPNSARAQAALGNELKNEANRTPDPAKRASLLKQALGRYETAVAIYAEDPDNNFFPSPGKIEMLTNPEGPGIRVDSGVYAGWTVSIDYDPLLAKLIGYGIDARKKRFPDERPFVYAPHANAGPNKP